MITYTTATPTTYAAKTIYLKSVNGQITAYTDPSNYPYHTLVMLYNSPTDTMRLLPATQIITASGVGSFPTGSNGTVYLDLTAGLLYEWNLSGAYTLLNYAELLNNPSFQ